MREGYKIVKIIIFIIITIGWCTMVMIKIIFGDICGELFNRYQFFLKNYYVKYNKYQK